MLDSHHSKDIEKGKTYGKCKGTTVSKAPGFVKLYKANVVTHVESVTL